MGEITTTNGSPWNLPTKILFRFFFIFFVLIVAPWFWLGDIPGANFILGLIDQLIQWLTIKANFYFFNVFNVRNVKLVYNGSGDTSYYWAQTCLFLSTAAIGAIVWSVLDRKRKGYRQLNYVLCLLLRYNLAIVALGYGFQKVLYLQMPFPSISQLATPLGDLLPMRLSWLFIGYSTPYQIFSGVMEVVAGLLLLWRRTATMGVMVATAVFMNVMMLNLCYDIPVKLFSMSLVLMCLYLLVNEFERIACFFVLNKTAPACTIYHHPLTKKWLRVTRVVLKVMVIFIISKGFYDTWKYAGKINNEAEIGPIKSGVYDVTQFALNSDTLAPLLTDTTRWQDVIFEPGGMGSIKTADTSFRTRYGRGYFFYKPDTLKHTLVFKKFEQDSNAIAVFNFRIRDDNTILFWGKKQKDSLYVELKKSNRRFQLAERQFHWLSEANR